MVHGIVSIIFVDWSFVVYPLDSRRMGSRLPPTCTGCQKKARGPKLKMFAEIRSSSAEYLGKVRD
jgi:hypothetical protein